MKLCNKNSKKIFFLKLKKIQEEIEIELLESDTPLISLITNYPYISCTITISSHYKNAAPAPNSCLIGFTSSQLHTLT